MLSIGLEIGNCYTRALLHLILQILSHEILETSHLMWAVDFNYCLASELKFVFGKWVQLLFWWEESGYPYA